MIQIVRVTDALPDGLDALRVASRAEGFRHIDRLAEDWASGACRFEQDGEALFAAFADGELAGIGGVTRDPDDPAIMRARRVYVLPHFRGAGAGRALAGAIIEQAFAAAPRISVNTGDRADSAAFWEHLGFARVEILGITHTLARE
jgi:GNAT superfamily N-acetyltransferase